MSHADIPATELPNSEPARIATYLAGFALGALAVAVGITMLVIETTRVEVWWSIVGLGLALMGQGTVATLFVPGVRSGTKN